MGEVSLGGADISPTSLIVHFVDFHCTAVVPVTTLNTQRNSRAELEVVDARLAWSRAEFELLIAG
jgi:hypothetical protein